MAVMELDSFSLLHIHNHFPPIHKHNITSSSSNTPKSQKNLLTRRRAIALGPSLFVAVASSLTHLALAQQQQEDPLEQEEDRVVQLFQEASPSVVFIKDLEIVRSPRTTSDDVNLIEDENAKVEGTGSGFIWDKFGHIVTNYHVVAKLATDGSGIHRCKIYLADTRGNGFYREGKIVGVDPAYDLAVLKNLHVGQSCFAIGNPYGYENTLTTGVVSGLAREIPSPNGRAIRGAIQTDADINAGKFHFAFKYLKFLDNHHSFSYFSKDCIYSIHPIISKFFIVEDLLSFVYCKYATITLCRCRVI
ncbi:protease Do-like 5, chloroplastic isoform X3 [Quercus lobata]|uniref:protease Do-like 5, chloroplastic isoform X3 n=1 Tax=Quercus lobata TaxID=97700 RepID=UPI001244219C|nr:protease Do-like 5, chloroplastic isoform X3 [Quercus lobata]